jgi:hypothetical protein
MRLLTEPEEEGGGGGGETHPNQETMTTPLSSPPQVHYIQVTQEEKEAIDRVNLMKKKEKREKEKRPFSNND